MTNLRRSALGLGAALLLTGLIAGCGSTPNTAAIKTTCQSISAVLSDGPDPGVDPVGYAEAQIDPLRQIKTSDQQLEHAIDNLASAYQQFFDQNGGQSAKRAVSQASRAVNKICPGAAS